MLDSNHVKDHSPHRQDSLRPTICSFNPCPGWMCVKCSTCTLVTNASMCLMYFADMKPWRTRVILMGSSWVANDIDSSFKIRPRPYPSFDILYRSCVVLVCNRPARMNVTSFLLSGRTQKRQDSVARIVANLLAD